MEKYNWWEKESNKTSLELPVSIIREDNHWIIGTNKDTETLIGELACVTAQGDTKEEAIDNFFSMLKSAHEFEKKWIPFGMLQETEDVTHWMPLPEPPKKQTNE